MVWLFKIYYILERRAAAGKTWQRPSGADGPVMIDAFPMKSGAGTPVTCMEALSVNQ